MENKVELKGEENLASVRGRELRCGMDCFEFKDFLGGRVGGEFVLLRLLI